MSPPRVGSDPVVGRVADAIDKKKLDVKIANRSNGRRGVGYEVTLKGDGVPKNAGSVWVEPNSRFHMGDSAEAVDEDWKPLATKKQVRSHTAHVAAKAIENAAQRSVEGSAWRKLAEKKFGMNLKAFALSAISTITGGLADAKDAKDPAKVSAIADRVQRGEVVLDSLFMSPLYEPVRRELTRRFDLAHTI